MSNRQGRAAIACRIFRCPLSRGNPLVLWSCELQFFLREPSSPRQGGVVALPGKSKTAKPCLFSAFHKHLSGPTSWPPEFAASTASVYPVASAAIRRTMPPNSRLVR